MSKKKAATESNNKTSVTVKRKQIQKPKVKPKIIEKARKVATVQSNHKRRTTVKLKTFSVKAYKKAAFKTQKKSAVKAKKTQGSEKSNKEDNAICTIRREHSFVISLDGINRKNMTQSNKSKKQRRIPLHRRNVLLQQQDQSTFLPKATTGTLRLEDVPWFKEIPCFEPKIDSFPKQKKTLPVVSLEFVHMLHKEIEALASYVKLTPGEIKARQFVLTHIETLVNANFSSKAVVKPFGSFATLGICTYCSDIDMALWNVVDTNFNILPHNKTDNPKKTTSNNNESSTKNHINSNNGTSSKGIKAAKWKAALDEAAIVEHNTNSSKKNMLHRENAEIIAIEHAVDRNSTVSDSSKKREMVPKRSTVLVVDNGTKTNKKKKRNQNTAATEFSPKRKKMKTNFEVAFVIDRKGEQVCFGNGNCDKESNEPHISIVNDVVNNDVNITSLVKSGTEAGSVDARYDGVCDVASEFAITNVETTMSVVVSDHPNVVSTLRIRGGNNTKDSDDSADKMSSFYPQQHASDGRRNDEFIFSSSTISSGCHIRHSSRRSYRADVDNFVVDDSKYEGGDDYVDDSSDDDSSDYGDDIGNDDNCNSDQDDVFLSPSHHRFGRSQDGIEVSCVHEMQSPSIDWGGPAHRLVSSPRLSAGTRKSIVAALRSLSRRLRKSPLTHSVEVIQHARVPIITLGTKLGFEGDICVGGHTGSDTSQYAAIHAQKFQSFASVVLLLKILLRQSDLDKPFTGGLGSYKLYVLVAHHIEKHIAMGGDDHAAEVLISFFVRFGNVAEYEHDCEAVSELSNRCILFSNDGGEADLQPVFKIDQCVMLFNSCFRRLMERFKTATKSGNKNVSFLSSILDASKLKQERQEYLRKSATLSTLQSSSNDTNSLIGRNYHQKVNSNAKMVHVLSKSEEVSFSVSPGNAPSPDKRRENVRHEENKLMAGYGVQRGPRNLLIPKCRPGGKAGH